MAGRWSIADRGRKSSSDAEPESDADVRRRQKAASCLRRAKLTDDPAERESLRRQAAQLLAPRKRRRPTDAAHDEDDPAR
jgi:hypothetical protein